MPTKPLLRIDALFNRLESDMDDHGQQQLYEYSSSSIAVAQQNIRQRASSYETSARQSIHQSLSLFDLPRNLYFRQSKFVPENTSSRSTPFVSAGPADPNTGDTICCHVRVSQTVQRDTRRSDDETWRAAPRVRSAFNATTLYANMLSFRTRRFLHGCVQRQPRTMMTSRPASL